jgi:hypothetical protein
MSQFRFVSLTALAALSLALTSIPAEPCSRVVWCPGQGANLVLLKRASGNTSPAS